MCVELTVRITRAGRLAVLVGGGAHVTRISRLQPIGARDGATYSYLRDYGIDTVYTGCLSLTLTREWERLNEPAADAAVLVVPKYESDIATIQTMLPPAIAQDAQLVQIHMHDEDRNDTQWRLIRAWELMHLYGTARLVLTSALHAALPSIAYDTPIIFVHDLHRFYNDARFTGLSEVFPIVKLLGDNGDTTSNQQKSHNLAQALVGMDLARPPRPSEFPSSNGALRRLRRQIALLPRVRR